MARPTRSPVCKLLRDADVPLACATTTKPALLAVFENVRNVNCAALSDSARNCPAILMFPLDPETPASLLVPNNRFPFEVRYAALLNAGAEPRPWAIRNFPYAADATASNAPELFTWRSPEEPAGVPPPDPIPLADLNVAASGRLSAPVEASTSTVTCSERATHARSTAKRSRIRFMRLHQLHPNAVIASAIVFHAHDRGRCRHIGRVGAGENLPDLRDASVA